MLVRKNIVVGTYAFMLPAEERGRSNGATHEWTCMLRSRDPREDLSTFVRKVTFMLHPSFVQPQRVFEQGEPFYFTEFGWGEFEITCRISFVDPDEKFVELKHYLKLYPENTVDISMIPVPSIDNYRENCIVSETYDEIIFRSASRIMVEAVNKCSQRLLAEHPLSPYFRTNVKSEEAEFIAMHHILQTALIAEQERLKSVLLEKTNTVSALMNIYYCCRPDKALMLLAQHPQLFALCAGDTMDPTDKAALVDNIRTLTKHIGVAGKDGGFISRERVNECVSIFRSLISKGLLGTSFGTCLATLYSTPNDHEPEPEPGAKTEKDLQPSSNPTEVKLEPPAA